MAEEQFGVDWIITSTGAATYRKDMEAAAKLEAALAALRAKTTAQGKAATELAGKTAATGRAHVDAAQKSERYTRTQRLIAQIMRETGVSHATASRAVRVFGTDLDRAEKEGAQYARSMDRAEKEVRDLATAQRLAAQETRKAAAGMSFAQRNAAALRTQLLGVAAAYLGVHQAARLLGESRDAALELQGIRRALEAGRGSAVLAADDFAFMRSEVDRLGLVLPTAAFNFAQMTAAARGTALEGEEVRKIFSAVSGAMLVLNRDEEATRGALRAIEQAMSKGKIQAEELRGQLGERLPGAFQLMARGLGVSTAELNKMLERGEVLSDVALPALRREIEKTFGPQTAVAAASDLAALNRLKTAVFEFKAELGEGLLPALADTTKEVTAWLAANRDTAREIGELVGGSLTALLEILGALVDNWELLAIALVAIKWQSVAGAVTALTAAITGQTLALRTWLASAGGIITILAALGIAANVAISAFGGRMVEGINAAAASSVTFRQRQDELTAAIQSGNRALIEAKITEYTVMATDAAAALATATLQADIARKKLLATEAGNETPGWLQTIFGASEATDEARAAFERYTTARGEATAEDRTAKAALEALRKALSEIGTKEEADRVRKLTDEQQKAIDAYRDTVKALKETLRISKEFAIGTDVAAVAQKLLADGVAGTAEQAVRMATDLRTLQEEVSRLKDGSDGLRGSLVEQIKAMEKLLAVTRQTRQPIDDVEAALQLMEDGFEGSAEQALALVRRLRELGEEADNVRIVQDLLNRKLPLLPSITDPQPVEIDDSRTVATEQIEAQAAALAREIEIMEEFGFATRQTALEIEIFRRQLQAGVTDASELGQRIRAATTEEFRLIDRLQVAEDASAVAGTITDVVGGALQDIRETGEVNFERIWQSFADMGFAAIEAILQKWLTAQFTGKALDFTTGGAGAAGGGAGGAATGAAAAAGGALGVAAIFVAVWELGKAIVASNKAKRFGTPTRFDFGVRSSGAVSSDFAANRDVFDAMADGVNAFRLAIGGVLADLPRMEIQIRNDGEKFRATVAGVLLGTFDTAEKALEAALSAAFRGSTWASGVGEEMARALGRVAQVGVEKFLALAPIISEIDLVAEGATRSLAQNLIAWRQQLTALDIQTEQLIRLGVAYEKVIAWRNREIQAMIAQERQGLLGLAGVSSNIAAIGDAMARLDALRRSLAEDRTPDPHAADSRPRLPAPGQGSGGAGSSHGGTTGVGGGPGRGGPLDPSPFEDDLLVIRTAMEASGTAARDAAGAQDDLTSGMRDAERVSQAWQDDIAELDDSMVDAQLAAGGLTDAFITMALDVAKLEAQGNVFSQLLAFQEEYGIEVVANDRLRSRIAEIEFAVAKGRIQLALLDLALNAEILGLTRAQMNQFQRWAAEIGALEFSDTRRRRPGRAANVDTGPTPEDQAASLRELADAWTSLVRSIEQSDLANAVTAAQEKAGKAWADALEMAASDPAAYEAARLAIEAGLEAELRQIGQGALAEFGGEISAVRRAGRAAAADIRFLLEHLEELGITAGQVAASVRSGLMPDILALGVAAAEAAGDTREANRLRGRQAQLERAMQLAQLAAWEGMLTAAGVFDQAMQDLFASIRANLAAGAGPQLESRFELIGSLGSEFIRLRREGRATLRTIGYLIEHLEELGLTAGEVASVVTDAVLPGLLAMAIAEAERVGDTDRAIALRQQQADIERKLMLLQISLWEAQLAAAGAITAEIQAIIDDLRFDLGREDAGPPPPPTGPRQRRGTVDRDGWNQQRPGEDVAGAAGETLAYIIDRLTRDAMTPAERLRQQWLDIQEAIAAATGTEEERIEALRLAEADYHRQRLEGLKDLQDEILGERVASRGGRGGFRAAQAAFEAAVAGGDEKEIEDAARRFLDAAGGFSEQQSQDAARNLAQQQILAAIGPLLAGFGLGPSVPAPGLAGSPAGLLAALPQGLPGPLPAPAPIIIREGPGLAGVEASLKAIDRRLEGLERPMIRTADAAESTATRVLPLQEVSDFIRRRP